MDELLKVVSVGGDVGTWAIVFVYLKHSNMLAALKAKVDYIERYLINRREGTL